MHKITLGNTNNFYILSVWEVPFASQGGGIKREPSTPLCQAKLDFFLLFWNRKKLLQLVCFLLPTTTHPVKKKFQRKKAYWRCYQNPCSFFPIGSYNFPHGWLLCLGLKWFYSYATAGLVSTMIKSDQNFSSNNSYQGRVHNEKVC